MAEEFECVREVRGMGLMLGVELKFDALPVIQGMAKRGVIVLSSGISVVRFLPPLTFTEELADAVVERMRDSLLEASLQWRGAR